MIEKQTLKKFKEKFESDKLNLGVSSSIAKVGINEASLNQNAIRRHNQKFSVTTKKGSITQQKASGRCWMFAALNTARVDTMKKYNLKTTEFSQVYTLFWDKLERSNYILDSIIDTVKESRDSRMISYLLKDPLCDGGQWDMFKGILKKYGIVPKDHMPETYHSSNTRVMDDYLTSMLRYFAYELRTEYEKSNDKDKLVAMKEDMLYKIYNILVKCLGNPPEKVNFEYVDKDEKYGRLPEMTPQEFFKEAIGWNLDDRVSVINAPTKDKPYGKVYTVKYLGSVAESGEVRYLNVPNEVMKKAAIDALKDGEPVWFGCDVGKLSESEHGIMDMDMFNYELTMGYYPNWTKETRLDYYESLLTHAMVFTGVNLDENGNPINWQVENSWGDKVGEKGIFSMGDEWFDTFMYQIMIDKKYLPKEWQDKLNQEPVELAPWDPMGALAL
ncbi:MAG: aminopeptidase [Clostridiales bacterium]|nr:MAG: aminopeptidase [Clostridiales bacterium]